MPSRSHDPERIYTSSCAPVSIQYRDNVNHGVPLEVGGSGPREACSHNEVMRLECMEKAIQEKTREAGQATHDHSHLEHLYGEIQKLIMEVAALREKLVRCGDIELYSMRCSPHGIAVVIVNEIFDLNCGNEHLNQRRGAAEDSIKFCTLFKHLGYTVQPYKNLDSFHMLDVVQKIAHSDHRGYDSFVLCVSSHGTDTALYGSDGKEVKRKVLFGEVKKCDTLKGKPKMFFVQACRSVGTNTLGSLGVTSDGLLDPHLDADCFIANAVTSENSAYRSPESGSWFVNALWKVLTTKKDTCTLTSMMHLVNNMVLQAEGTTGDDPAEGRCTQCAEVTTTCTKDIMFCDHGY